MANSGAALSASVWTAHPNLRQEVASELDCPHVGINGHALDYRSEPNTKIVRIDSIESNERSMDLSQIQTLDLH